MPAWTLAQVAVAPQTSNETIGQSDGYHAGVSENENENGRASSRSSILQAWQNTGLSQQYRVYLLTTTPVKEIGPNIYYLYRGVLETLLMG